MPVVVDLPQSAVDAVVRVGIDISSVRVATTLREADGDRQLAVATASGLPGAGTRGCTTGLGGGEEQREGSEDFEHVLVYLFFFFLSRLKKKCYGEEEKKVFFAPEFLLKKSWVMVSFQEIESRLVLCKCWDVGKIFLKKKMLHQEFGGRSIHTTGAQKAA